LKSKLDPKIYGPAESAITTEMIEQQIRGYATVEEVCFHLMVLSIFLLSVNFVTKLLQFKQFNDRP